MQRISTGIQTEQNLILVKGNTEGILGSMFLEKALMIVRSHTVYHGFFHYGLNISGRKNLGFHGACFGNPKGSIPWQIFFQRKSLGSLKQILIGFRMEGSQL
jgi:hypothetical protein